MKKWNWKLIGISLAILAVVVVVSMLIFPEWNIRFGVIGATVLIIVVAAPEIVDFLSKAKKLYTKEEEKEASPTTEVHTEGGDNVAGDKNTESGNYGVAVGGNVEGDVIINPPVPQKDPAIQSLHQIPAPPQDFTGREEELAILCQAVQNEGVVFSSVRGMGGVGKTALALVLAQRLIDDYPNAKILIDMYGSDENKRPPRTPAEAMQHVIRSFNIEEEPPEDFSLLKSRYLSVLNEKKAIILLDDAQDADQVKHLIPPATCLLLVTTRNRFTLPGLRELDLDTMSEAESITLIEKITPRAGEKAGAIAQACGYLPLALRLAASALREQANLSADALLARLKNAEKRFKTLEKMHATIQVSYDLLSKDLQSALRQLTVFPTDFIQIAAQAVWNIDEYTTQTRLAGLMNASMVDYDTKTQRYKLHNLVRAVVEKLLKGDEKYQAAYRHAAHYLEILQVTHNLYLEGGQQILNALNLFIHEWDNIQSGQNWATTHSTSDIKSTQLCINYPIAAPYCISLRLHSFQQINWLESARPPQKTLRISPVKMLYSETSEIVTQILADTIKPKFSI